MHGALSDNYIVLQLASADKANQEEQDNRAQDRYDQTGKVKSSDSLCSEDVAHQETADEGTDDTNNDVSERAHLCVPAHDDACNPSSDGTKDDP
jgi:hypothetical protein